MSYSKVIEPALKTKRVNAMPLIGGAGVIQDLGYIERKTHRFFWITTAELQVEIDAEVAAGWILDGDPSRTLVHEAIADLFNAEATYYRFIAL